GGDTDTAGAITGALSGARNGRAALPPSWQAEVEGRDEIVALARELFDTTGRRRG
ncbi:MAG: ADP-ribosylglycohydrolase family protein, partial [candidate division NC10 bacterium]